MNIFNIEPKDLELPNDTNGQTVMCTVVLNHQTRPLDTESPFRAFVVFGGVGSDGKDYIKRQTYSFTSPQTEQQVEEYLIQNLNLTKI